MVEKKVKDSLKHLPVMTNAFGLRDGACFCEICFFPGSALPRDVFRYVNAFQCQLRFYTKTVMSRTREWDVGYLPFFSGLGGGFANLVLNELCHSSYKYWRFQSTSSYHVQWERWLCPFLNIAVEDIFQGYFRVQSPLAHFPQIRRMRSLILHRRIQNQSGRRSKILFCSLYKTLIHF